ncbi:MAG TPA: 4-alpha-glucanotransferase, partial [Nannocystaceae bacterium]|nr:4-alpha-glucanotransferase [Nannocystaceae bacterium]
MDLEHPLYRLARAHGLQAGYVDYTGEARGADPEVLRAVLQALGAGVDEPGLQAQIDEIERARWSTPIEPVLVAWDGQVTAVVRVPKAFADRRVVLRVDGEGGTVLEHASALADHAVVGQAHVGGTDYVAFAITPAGPLALGYHRLEVEVDGRAGEHALVLSAPRRVWCPPDERNHHGVFVPLYALHSERSLGVGNLGDLGDLYGWVEKHRGSVVATLPLLAGYFDEPCDPSPYTPCSRLAWNELYLDVEAMPELADCERARTRLDDSDTRALVARLRSQPLVDYRAEMSLRRRILDPLAAHVFERGGPRRAALEAFAAERPEIVAYSRFRAYQERMHATWEAWPAEARSGTLRDRDVDPAIMRVHLYAQFGMHEQLGALAERMRGGGLGLYLDLPVGVHGHGFDPWVERDAFVRGLATGAPPDILFAGGQNWAFPPLHPERTRIDGHRYFIAMIRNHLRYASVLRIDHVMGLHRLYVIPQGASAKHGIYLRYPADELYAILSIESHRSGTLLVGEDLGTVPPEVHAAMAEHGVHGMHVVEYGARAEGRALEP